MAIIRTDHERRRWLIHPLDIMERSALFEMPSRKWMTQLNVISAPFTPANARILAKLITDGQVLCDNRMSVGQLEEYERSVEELTRPARTDRQFPTWYKFNNTVFSPLEHQYEGLRRLYPVNECAIFMAMGTCKTRIMIDLMSAHFFERRIQFVIIIAPMTVKMSAWQDDLEKFSPCPYNFVDVDSSFKAKNFKVTPDRLTWLVVGVESLSQGKTFNAIDPVTRLGIPFGCGVDESTRIKNNRAICTQAAYKLRLRAKVKFIATGHEIERSVEDLYSQFEFLSPNIIGCGDYYAFKNRYCKMGGYKSKQVIGYNNMGELMGLISPHVFQCDKSVLKLPPKVYERRLVEMQPEQKLAYGKVKKGMMEGVTIQNVLTKTLRLQQVANGFIHEDNWYIDEETGKKYKREGKTIEIVPPGRNPKLNELLRIADEISHPMIVWAESTYEHGIIVAALSKLGAVIEFTGATLKEERQDLVREFQKGHTPFWVGNTASGGIGITLTAARTVTYFSNSQRLGYRVQSEDRAHRKGQPGSVTILDLICKGTVDQAVLKLYGQKIEIAQFVQGALRDKIALEKFFDGDVVITQPED